MIRQTVVIGVLCVTLVAACTPIQSPPVSSTSIPVETSHEPGRATDTTNTSDVLAIVDGAPVTVAEFQTRVRLQRLELEIQLAQFRAMMPKGMDSAEFNTFFPMAGELQAALDSPEYMAGTAFESLLEEHLVSAEAEARDLPLDEVLLEDILRSNTIYLAEVFTNTLRTGPGEVTRSLDELGEAAEAFVAPLLAERELTVEDWRAMRAAKTRVQDVIDAIGAESVAAQGMQVHVQEAIFFNAADAIQQRLAAEFYDRWRSGEDFAALVAEYELPTIVPATSGDLEWVSPGTRWPGWDEAVAEIEVGEIGHPFATVIGLHVVKVMERSESRPKSRDTLSQEYMPVYDKWLDEQMALIDGPSLAQLVELLPAQ